MLIKPRSKIIQVRKINCIFGSAKGIIYMSEDFDEPLEDFKAYM